MNYLQLAQALHREARYAGTAPTTLSGATGQTQDIAEWIKEAWFDIQRMHNGQWRWLWRKFSLATTASDGEYAYTDATDTIASAAISRFHAWKINDYYRPAQIYLTSAGSGAEQWLVYTPYEEFMQVYGIGTQNNGYPVHITIDPQDNIRLGPVPDDAYTITGDYWRSPQELSSDTDEPECPSHFHMAIVYEALAKYAYANVAPEAIARANSEGTKVLAALTFNQGAAMKRFRKARPLA